MKIQFNENSIQWKFNSMKIQLNENSIQWKSNSMKIQFNKKINSIKNSIQCKFNSIKRGRWGLVTRTSRRKLLIFITVKMDDMHNRPLRFLSRHLTEANTIISTFVEKSDGNHGSSSTSSIFPPTTTTSTSTTSSVGAVLSRLAAKERNPVRLPVMNRDKTSEWIYFL